MLTRCPNCATHFRVTADQLKVRLGRVRCGQCQNVFNALDGLIEEAPPAPLPIRGQPVPIDADAVPATSPATAIEATLPLPAPGAPPAEVAAPPAPTPEAAASVPPDAPDEAAAGAPDGGSDTVIAEPGAPVPAHDAPTDAADAAGEDGASGPASANADEAVITSWREADPAPRRRWPWVAGSLLALAALVVQALLAFRVELAVVSPELRPVLVALCDLAGCELGLPAKVALIGIEASDLHPDSTRPGRLVLSATLKNRAPFAQQYPHLELTLTDTADKAVARKVLAPADYLPPRTTAADGMPTSADIAVVVGIEAAQLPASGYRLYLFYP